MTKARDIASAIPAPSTVSSAELGYLDGVTSAIQTQVDAKIAKTLTTTTGDIIYASGANTPARLGIGSSAQVLTVSGGVPAWAASAGGGKVLQVVNATYSTETSSSSNTYADTGLTATITPTSATSKVLVIVTQQGIQKQLSTSVELKLLRAGSDILTMGDVNAYTNSTAFNAVGSVSASYLDSPATTSATIYKTQFRSQANTSTAYVQAYRITAGTSQSTITLMEIGA